MKTDRKMLFLAATALLAASAVAFQVQNRLRLMVDGREASSDVRIIDGRVYAPLHEVATALGFQLRTVDGGYEIVRPGGNTLVREIEATLGREAVAGPWRVSFIRSDAVATYNQSRLRLGNKTFAATQSEQFLLLRVRIANGGANEESLVLDPQHGLNTAVFDDKGNRYRPVAYDFANNLQNPNGVTLVPGATTDVNVLFRMPRGAAIDSAVLSLIRYADRGEAGRQQGRFIDVRVGLDPNAL